jgi:HlyD family secretion protein
MNQHSLPDPSEIEAVLGVDARGRSRRWGRRLFWLGLFALAVAGAVWWWMSSQAASRAVTYDTAPVTRTDLTVTISATGTIQPTTQVEVSSEMSGVVRAVNVTNNSPVKKGEKLAELDTDRLKAQLDRANATVSAAKARLLDAKATLTERQLTLERQETLRQKRLAVAQDVETARAGLARAEAAVTAAEADIAVAEADLVLKQTDIDKSVIVSPVDGIVLSRAVEPGQTVASSLQAPILFTLAEDLTHMQMEADVDEADIGAVQVGQKASFTVDAYRGTRFPAEIETVEFSPQTVEGVVTYKAVLRVDNSKLLLRPGMTATALITVQEVKQALAIPNAALRYAPPAARQSRGFSIMQFFLPRMPRTERATRPEAVDGRRDVWVLREGKPVSVSVRTGVTDGLMTEVLEGDISAQDAIITATRSAGQ